MTDAIRPDTYALFLADTQIWYCLSCGIWQILWRHPYIWWIIKKRHRTQQIVVHTAVIYYDQRIQSKIRERKRHVGQSQGNQAQASEGPSQWSHRGHTQFSSKGLWLYEVLPTREVHWGPCIQSFYIKGWWVGSLCLAHAKILDC